MQAEGKVLLSTSYFGPVQYFTKFLLYPERIIEQYDHYGKQTYRNRCMVYGANGKLSLSVPVLKGTEHKSHVRDVRIDYSRNWRKLHWKGLESAYRHSPFFEFHTDEIRSLLDKKHEYLMDLNLEILDYLLEVLEIEGGYSLTGEYAGAEGIGAMDIRDAIHPKKGFTADADFRPEPYFQVFAERQGFLENLSIVDLIFNEGPNARSVLERSIRRD